MCRLAESKFEQPFNLAPECENANKGGKPSQHFYTNPPSNHMITIALNRNSIYVCVPFIYCVLNFGLL